MDSDGLAPDRAQTERLERIAAATAAADPVWAIENRSWDMLAEEDRERYRLMSQAAVAAMLLEMPTFDEYMKHRRAADALAEAAESALQVAVPTQASEALGGALTAYREGAE